MRIITCVSYFGFHAILSFCAGLLQAVDNGYLSINISASPYLDIVDIDAMEHGGQYDCIVRNNAGFGRATAILYVEPYFTLQPVDIFANYRETVSFTCMAESFPYPSYQWQRLQGSRYIDILNKTDMTLTIDVDDDSDGVYRCVAMSLILGNTFSIISNEAILHGKLINSTVT